MVQFFRSVLAKKDKKPKTHQELQADVRLILNRLAGKKMNVTIETPSETKQISGILKKAAAEIMGSQYQCLHFCLDIDTHCIGTLELSSIREEADRIVILCEPNHSQPGRYNKIITITK